MSRMAKENISCDVLGYELEIMLGDRDTVMILRDCLKCKQLSTKRYRVTVKLELSYQSTERR